MEESIVAVEAKRTGTAVFETSHHPGDKNVAGSEDRLGGDDRLGCIDAKEKILPVDRSIREHEQDETTFRAAVVDGCVAVFNGNSDGEWGNIDNADHNAQVTCNAYIRPTVDEGRSGT